MARKPGRPPSDEIVSEAAKQANDASKIIVEATDPETDQLLKEANAILSNTAKTEILKTAWNSARGACEFVKDDEGKKACREEMEKMAGDIKNIKDGSEVIYNAIKSSSNPADFIQAQIAFARTHNEINVKAILKWADEMEASGKTIDPETAQVVKFYRLQESTQI